MTGLTSERCLDCECPLDDHYGEHIGGGCACGDCEGYRDTAAPLGPCAGCGRQCVGDHIAGTVYAFSCDACDQQINDDFADLLDRAIRGDLP